VDFSNRTQKMINLKFKKENEEDVEKYVTDDNLKKVTQENGKNETKFGLVLC